MTPRVEAFDHWIRDTLVALNTELEERYYASETPGDISGIGDDLKQQLVDQGREHIAGLLREGNTDEGFDAGYDLLGNVGLYMASCRRHDITEPSRESKSPLVEASALAMQLGASLGVVPRFASAHLELHNLAVDGTYKSFTRLQDEFLFLNHNTLAALSYIQASEALLKILPLGVSHPITANLLRGATSALRDVIKSNQKLFERLDVNRFFYCVRPYYKPHRVGLREYRGANAGDFAGINVIDLLLGLCRADDPVYSQLLVDKFLYMPPDEQLILRDCMRRESLMDGFLESLQSHADANWFQENAALFLETCEAHGETARQHHEQLVQKFIETPADRAGISEQEDLTASGPPLPVLLKSLRKLADMRCAVDRDDIPSRFNDIQRLRTALGRQ